MHLHTIILRFRQTHRHAIGAHHHLVMSSHYRHTHNVTHAIIILWLSSWFVTIREMSKNTHRGARPLNTDGMHDGWCSALRQRHILMPPCLSSCDSNDTPFNKAGGWHALYAFTRMMRCSSSTGTQSEWRHAILILWLRQTHRRAIIILWIRSTHRHVVIFFFGNLPSQTKILDGRTNVYAPQTKILEGLTKDEMRLFEALFKGVSTRFGLIIIESPFENQELIFCSFFQNLRLGSITFQNAFSKHFSREWVLYLGYESLKNASKAHSERSVRLSKIFVWGA